ncbi:hypothetical protein ACEPAH_1154 [Sanghuangporus vaninii]
MALQPKRTWSAEDERRRRLEEDPDAYDVGPHSVTCAGCHRPIRLNATGRYYAANWNKHKMGCKNTNAVNGANAMSAESKFTGRVAAFRVAKPTENTEPLVLSASSSNPVPHELDRIHADVVKPSHPQDRNQSTPSRFTRPPSFRYEQHTPGISTVSRDRPRAIPYPSIRSNSSGALYSGLTQSPLLASHKPSRSPNVPSLRLEEQGSYGPIEAPFGEDVQNDRSSYGVPTSGVQRGRANSTPSHHSEDTQRLAYLGSRDAFLESKHLLDKGKRRYFESTRSNSHHYSPLRKYAHLGADLRMHDRVSDLDSYPSRTEAADASSSSNKARDWRESHGISDIDSNSTASPPGFGARQAGRSQQIPASFSPKPLPQDTVDERVLPPLNSLSLAKPIVPGPLSRTDRSGDYRGMVHYDSSRVAGAPEDGYSWRERTRAWVQTGATSLVIDRDSPESVVLPPIRDGSGRPRGSPVSIRRRQREDDEHDDNSMDEDRPSPPKVLVLPLGQSHSSSTPRTDDLSLEYKHADVSSGEDMNIGGDSTFVGNHSQYGRENLTVTKTDAPRLHPVWKWEQREEASKSTGAASQEEAREGMKS